MKKSEDVEAWLLGMRNLFRLHDYLENMKAKISTFILKWKVDIQEGNLTWNEFERLFKNNYLLERYYYDRAKRFYEL